ncbi:MAG: VWA domain-containing protein [Butyrivibrio sp.]|nr:VWA domain-containing protein [Butyrivibrio sp.]
MSIRPMLPLGIMIIFFALLCGATAFVIIRNKLNIADKIFTLIRLFVIYALVFVIGCRPVILEKKYEFSTKNLDVLFVVDTTISMWAEDYNGRQTRMKGVTKDVESVIDELAGSNFGLVTFDDTSHVLSPFTQDGQYVKDLFETFVSPEVFYAKGSDLSLPYKDIDALLRSSAKKENRKTIVFYISDGEITNGKELTDYSDLAGYIDSGAVLGYGSDEGGKMKDGGEGTYYIYDYTTYDDAVSRIDEGNLQKIATDLGVPYYNMYKNNESLQGAVSMIKESSKTVTQDGKGVETAKDTYYWYAIPLALMLLLEIIMIIRRGRL